MHAVYIHMSECVTVPLPLGLLNTHLLDERPGHMKWVAVRTGAEVPPLPNGLHPRHSHHATRYFLQPCLLYAAE